MVFAGVNDEIEPVFYAQLRVDRGPVMTLEAAQKLPELKAVCVEKNQHEGNRAGRQNNSRGVDPESDPESGAVERIKSNCGSRFIDECLGRIHRFSVPLHGRLIRSGGSISKRGFLDNTKILIKRTPFDFARGCVSRGLSEKPEKPGRRLLASACHESSAGKAGGFRL